ncbi:MAG: hypothetical protein D6714_08575 [Bacteroidetes bacterium]|nr:MAG: hypothetical protein D6714_08575 [Bacteroidota bacterium]
MIQKTNICLTALFLLCFGISCQKTGKVVAIDADEFDIEAQILIGQKLREEIQSNPQAFPILPPSEYPAAYEYLNTLLNTVLLTPVVQNRTAFDWDISIIQNDSLQTAFALPGGHFFVYSGLLKFLDAEHQLLGVLAHELYYVDTDLMVQRLRSAFGGLVMGDILLGNEVAGLRQMVEEIPYLGFTSEEVLAADAYALQIICLFNYSPLGIQEIIQKADAENADLLWLSTRHSDKIARFQNFETLLADCETTGVTNVENYTYFKENDLP